MRLSTGMIFLLSLLTGFHSLTAAALEILNPAKPIPAIALVAKNLRKQTAEIATAPDGKPALKLTWNNSDANKLEFFFEPGADIPEFKKAIVDVEVYLTENSFSNFFYIRLIDSQVEIFQFRKFLRFDELPMGWQTFQFEINAEDLNNNPDIRTWGRNANRKINYPAKFFGFCIDFSRTRGSGDIYIGKISIRPEKQ